MLKAYIKDDFKNLLEYRSWVEHTIKNISSRNKGSLDMFEKFYVDRIIATRPAWFGDGTTFAKLNAGITTYKSPELIEKIYNQINDQISTAVRDKIKARKVMYNAMGLGLFNFDRASMGMFRLKELHSPSLKKTVEKEEVRKTKNGFELLKDSSAVLERWEVRTDGKPKIRTSSKNVYAYFPPIRRENKAVEMFISCGANSNTNAEQFLYSGISAIIVAQLLEKARVRTRISIVIGSSPDQYEKTAYGCVIPVKNNDESLDINLLALLTSDPRFFRYEGFKGIVSLYEHFGQKTPDSLGSGMTKDYLIKTIEQSDYAKKSKTASNCFYFGWTFSEAKAVQEVNNTIEEIAERLNQ